MKNAAHGSTKPVSEASSFLHQIITKDIEANVHSGQVVTRFPPEPNGYLHLGHSKSICLNFGLAQEFGGRCHLRFDDTNPETEDVEYVEAIQEDVRWLGFDWGPHLYFASDYFEQTYQIAEKWIREGRAYVCSLNEEELREYRGDFNRLGKNSPYRDRSIEENLRLFREMRAGKFNEGECTLRAKIDMHSPNMNMRDPLLYRIKKVKHHRTGDQWCIYPMYDFAHPLGDAIENITHSICTLEFQDHRPFYDWCVQYADLLGRPHHLHAAVISTVEGHQQVQRFMQLSQQWYKPFS
jgi:glutaminyl-tRNA synthetase